MITTTIIFIILCIYHFVYEMIIAPILRTGLRNELFALRDQLINVEIFGKSKIGNEAFDIMQDKVNFTLSALEHADIMNLLNAIMSYNMKVDFKEELDRRMAIVESVGNKELWRISDNIQIVLLKAIAVHHGAWALYLFPIIMAAVLYKKATGLGIRVFDAVIRPVSFNGWTDGSSHKIQHI